MKPDESSDGATDEQIATMRRIGDVASERLEERPDTRVRAAVLAAAARAVDAKPRVAGGTARAPFAVRHWPLSAAALLVVSVATGMLATRILRDDPERVTTAASEQQTPSERAPALVASNAPAAETPAQAASAKPASVAKPAPPRSRNENRARVTDADTRTSPTRRDEAGQATTTEGQASRPAAIAAPFAASPPPAKAIAAPAPAQAPARSGEARDKTDARTSPAATDSSTAASAARGRATEPPTPEAWVERIVRMRADGDDAGADRELDVLRRRYPDFAIPRAALGPAGTR